MRTDDEYRQILTLWEQGSKKKTIARLTGIPRATVRDCIERYHSVEGLEAIRKRLKARSDPPSSLRILTTGVFENSIDLFEAYTSLLGLYLGDGYINREPRTYKLRIFMDTHYPSIIHGCIRAIETLLPLNRVGTVKKHDNCMEVVSYNNWWPEFFPQHGPDRKHNRRISLETWQEHIVTAFPILLLKGFIHSDGSRSRNVVNGKDYPRYVFSNVSEDLKEIFRHAGDILGLHWTTAANGRHVQIAPRADVAFLDQVIGPKS